MITSGLRSLIADTLWGNGRRRDELSYSRCCWNFEVGLAIGLKYKEGFTRLWPSVWTVLAMIITLDY